MSKAGITLAMMEAMSGCVIQEVQRTKLSDTPEHLRIGNRNKKCDGCGHKNKKCTCNKGVM